MRITLIMFFCFLFTYSSFSQELKTRKKNSGEYLEVYTVLKEDKGIKHGQYLKFRLDILGNKSISEIGQFEQGKKTGIWLEFTRNGFLRSEGQYTNGIQSGLWNFYYEPINENPTIISLLSTNNGIIFNGNGGIEIDKESLIVSSKGVYHLGRKSGAWNYYSRQGQLLHKFNHDSNELLINNAPDTLNYLFPFLGGPDRFYSLYRTIKRDIKSALPSSNSKVIIELKINISPISAEIIEIYGDENFAKDVVESIKMVEEDYLTEFIDNVEGQLLFIAEFKIENGRNIFSTRFEQKNSKK